MAHTLSIWSGGTETSLASTGSSAGYKLIRYEPTEPAPEVVYNASMFTDGNRPVFSRTGNVVEQITLDLYGSSQDHIYTMLRFLKRVMWQARDAIIYPNLRGYVYLGYKPHGTTNTSYSIVLGGTVAEPPFDALSQEGDGPILSSKMLRVVLTVEREPYWRDKPPVMSTTLSDFSTAVVTADTMTPDWKQYNITSIGGELPALAYLKINHDASSNKSYWVMAGYSSQLRVGANYNNAGVCEAESLTLGSGVALSADAAASPGVGNTAAYVTPTTSYAVMVSGSRVLVGEYRVFGRVRQFSAATISMYFAWGYEGAPKTANAPVTYTNGLYGLVDFGVISVPTNKFTLANDQSLTGINFEVQVKRGATSGDAYIDFIFFMPLEYYWQSRLTSASTGEYTIYDGTIPWGVLQGDAHVGSGRNYIYNPTAKTQGKLMIPPGNGSLYLLIGSEYNTNYNYRTNAKLVDLYVVSRFTAARGDNT